MRANDEIDCSSDDDNVFFNSDDEIIEKMIENAVNEEKAENRIEEVSRRVNRKDYSRGPKLRRGDDPWNSNYWLLNLADPRVSDPTSRSGKKFRRDFRIPHIIFLEIIEMLKSTRDEYGNSEPIFNYPKRLICGIVSIPLEIKVLCALRTLASGLKFKDAAELSGYMSESSANLFFKQFNRLFRQHFAPLYIQILQGTDFEDAMHQYAMLGLPGCVGSIDATFVPWDKCSANLTNVCNGDKGSFSSTDNLVLQYNIIDLIMDIYIIFHYIGLGLLFEAVVTHSKQVVSVEGSYYATVNDKNTVKYSRFIGELNNKEIYRDISYKVRTGMRDDEFIELSDCYVIADGGYLEQPATIAGYSGVSTDPVKFKFTDWVASVRKDVESFLGILKKRFIFFKNPITLQSRIDIDNAFYTACIIHNMILKHDGLDKLWLDDRNMMPHDEDYPDDENVQDDMSSYIPRIHDDATFVPRYVHMLIPHYELSGGDCMKMEYEKLQKLLANHLQVMYRLGELRWSKSRKEIKLIFNDGPRENFPDAGDLE